MGVIGDEAIEAKLAELHARSLSQMGAMATFFAGLPPQDSPAAAQHAQAVRAFLADKMVALDEDKAAFCHQVILASGARRVVEIGTSYGVSTVYLADAVRRNLARLGGEGGVIGTEYEPEKAAAARALFHDTGLSGLIELREGDLAHSLADLAGPIDFVLMDIWLPAVAPALERLRGRLREGSVIVADNTLRNREGYAPLFAFFAAEGFSSVTLPYDGGLELAVKG